MKAVFSILLSFFILISGLPLTIGTHFCGGKATESKVILESAHIGCEMANVGKSYNCEQSNNKDNHFSETPCCKNEYQNLQNINNFVKESIQQVPFDLDFATAFVYTSLNLDLFPKPTNLFNTKYSPPPLEKDIQELFQIFLI